jgi:hypothetical protein
MRRLFLACLTVVLASGCVSKVGAPPRTGGSSAPTTTTSTWEPPPKVGRYAAGDCVVADEQAPVSCGRPHDYEVTLSDELPSGVPATYPPELDTVAGPVCIETLAKYTGSPDVDASRLQPAYLWPDSDEWAAGQRWFACLVSEDDVDGGAVRRSGSVRDVLADGLGDLRQCMENRPADPGESRNVPCDQPHRSEAVEPVIVLGDVSDPAPSQDEILAKTNEPCREQVREYIGGEERDGISWGMTYGSPEQWKKGFVTATCFVVSEQPVTGTLAR